MWRILFLLVVLCTPAWGQDYIVPGRRSGCTIPSFSADVLFWVSFENCVSSPCTGTYTMDIYNASTNPDGVDYTPNAITTMVRTANAEVSSTAALAGARGIDITPTAGTAPAFEYQGNTNPPTFDTTSGRVGFLFRYVTTVGATAPWILRFSSSGSCSGTTCLDFYFNSDGNDATFAYSTTTVSNTLSTTGDAFAPGNTYFVELVYDASQTDGLDTMSIKINGTTNASTVVAVLATPPSANLSWNRVGDLVTGDSGAFYIDALVNSSDETEDLYAGVCGSTTACTGGQKGSYCTP